jgi:hypothetical protein
MHSLDNTIIHFIKNFSPLVSLLVDMSHSNQIFIDHFIHVVDQLEVQYSIEFVRERTAT